MKIKYKNVYWFLIDGLSPSFLNSCGKDGYTTTFIDKCLSKGTVFSQVYSANGGTHTSMHVFFSGFYSSVNGATGWTREALRSFKPEIITLTDILKMSGYNTYRYCDAKGERAVPKSGFDVWASSGIHIGNVLKNTNYTDCPNRAAFINRVNADKNNKFVYYHVELLHELNCALGTFWKSEDYRKNVEITAKYFENLYKSFNIRKDDLVIISSDHGVLLDVDYTLYEHENGPRQLELSNICFFALQGKNIKCQLLPRLVSAIDIASTLAQLICDIDLPTQGHSLLPYIISGNYLAKPCYREKNGFTAGIYSPKKSTVFTVRDDNWKYTFSTIFPQSEWLINLEKHQDYTANLKDEYPELVKKYKKMIMDKLINNHINISDFYNKKGFGKFKSDLRPVVSIIVKEKHLNKDFMETILDLAGPYYNVVLTRQQAANLDADRLAHPKVVVADNKKIFAGQYILSLSTKFVYDDEDFLQKMLDAVIIKQCKVKATPPLRQSRFMDNADREFL